MNCLSYLFLFLLPLSFTAFSQQITVGNGGDFPTLSQAQSSVNPGDTLLVLDQIFTNGTQFLTINGLPGQPVVIMGQTSQGPIFQGGTEGLHLSGCNYVEINGLVFQQQTGNGLNIDDAGSYTIPSTHIEIKNCLFRDMAAGGNNDLLKMSGVDHFLISNCTFLNGGSGGSGIDFVGCHYGVVEDCYLDNAGTSGIQNKGGTQFITIQRNVFKNMGQRALNLGGSTGLQFFRPPLPNPIVDAFEAADIDVFSNVFIGNRAPIAYVGCVRVQVRNNTFYQPDNWVIRILQETTVPGFLTCADNEFSNNIIYLETDKTEVNIGSNTNPASFTFSHNAWYNEASNNWAPILPVTDQNQLIGDPLFNDPANEDFSLTSQSPFIGNGFSYNTPTTDFNQLPFANPPSRGAHEGAVAGTTDLSIRFLLEGAYDFGAGLMTDNLRDKGLLPAEDPWALSPNIPASALAVTGNDALVDWVMIEFRDPNNLATILHTTSGLVQRDGDLVSADGSSLISVAALLPEDVFLLIRHQNHLKAMHAVSVVANVISYDCTTQNAYEGGGTGQKELSPGVWALHAGNANEDNEITGADKASWILENGIFNVYSPNDFNLDGEVNGADNVSWFTNNGVFSVVP